MTDKEREARAYFEALDRANRYELVPAKAPLPVARVGGAFARAIRRLWYALRRKPIVRFNVCRNGHVIPEPGSTWCETCDSAAAFAEPRPLRVDSAAMAAARAEIAASHALANVEAIARIMRRLAEVERQRQRVMRWTGTLSRSRTPKP